MSDGGSGLVDLSDEQVDFSPNLGGASVSEVGMTLYGYDERTGEQVETEVTVSVRFAGTGRIVHDAGHGDLCWAMGAACQSVTVDSGRPATATLGLSGETATGSGSLSHGRYLYVGAPR